MISFMLDKGFLLNQCLSYLSLLQSKCVLIVTNNSLLYFVFRAYFLRICEINELN